MKPEDIITADVFAELMKDSIGFNLNTLELFAGLYICEKLKQDPTEKAASIIGGDMSNGVNMLLKSDYTPNVTEGATICELKERLQKREAKV